MGRKTPRRTFLCFDTHGKKSEKHPWGGGKRDEFQRIFFVHQEHPRKEMLLRVEIKKNTSKGRVEVILSEPFAGSGLDGDAYAGSFLTIIVLFKK